MAQTYSTIALQRIKKDLQNLKKEPVVNAGAQPRDGDITLWDAAISVKLHDDARKKLVKVPLHFNIHFPKDYPQSAPNIGFSYKFKYNLGASYTQQKPGPLNGKYVLCLDILGNFANVHSEWKNNVGSGWSPAYTVSSLLLNLQAILAGLNDDYEKSQNTSARADLIKSARQFAEKFADWLPEIATEETCHLAAYQAKLPKTTAKLAQDLEIFDDLKKLKILSAHLEGLSVKGQEVQDEPRVDENIKCYVTGALYTEDVLGYGISIVKNGRQMNLSTPAELISYSAFQKGHRQSSQKIQFQHFLPAFINFKHGPGQKKWMDILKASIQAIGKEAYSRADLAASAYEIFPRLMNTLVMEMMKAPEPPADYEYFRWDNNLGDAENIRRMEKYDADQTRREQDQTRCQKQPSIAFFEAICSFWRTYIWLNNNVLKAKLLPLAVGKVNGFVKNEEFRLKDKCPDVGGLLASYTAIQQNCKCTGQQFIDALLDETFTRNVLWWKRANVREESQAVFEATQTSREIVLFQIYFLRFIIGDNPKYTAELMDKTNGKAPELLESFFKQWKTAKKGDWIDYLKSTGCSADFIQFGSEAMIKDLVAKAKSRGSAYYPNNNNNNRYRR